MSVLFPGIADSIHVRLFAAAYVQLGRWWTETDRIRSMWRISRADEDGAFLDYGSTSYALPAGRFCLVPPGLDFTARLERKVNQFHVHFEVIGWPAAAVQDLLPEPITLEPDDMRDQLADELCNEVNVSEQLGPALSCRVKSLVHLILANLETALPAQKVALLRHIADGQLDLLDVLRYIDRHLEEPLDNGLLAEISHSSESCFIRRFREAMGQTPARYVQDRRIARASELLVCTDQSIDEVARRCGFANRYYFSRVFAERMGRPPVRYRNERPVAKVFNSQLNNSQLG
ncbi:MAG: helix-turn-helix transcriptional regulator [Deltaproteobacteria bacterium]|nr:helix-turn-helix transcriptional regulator [Deltaproteobacteria bacterium]MBW2421915.1 helix-turn-helix transcriptional regulator [Deltaproteobacteria bacterium]